MAFMTSSSLRRALRRALLLSLAVPGSIPVGCGGNVVDTETGSTGTSTGTSSSGTNNPGCTLVSSTPITTTGDCESTFDLVGDAAACTAGPYGMLSASQCAALCPPNSAKMTAVACWANDLDGGTTQLACAYYQPCGTGRRPPGLAGRADAGHPGPEGAGVVARFLSEVAHLEAASVLAFEGLARELEAYAAPARLVRAAGRAAREEVEHAGVMARFAERAGARPRRPALATPATARSLEAIAVENAVEGCVRETFGAVLAMRQAERARSADLRRAMKRIARDEAAHAELAWELARWLHGRLDEGARRRVDEARQRAVEALAREIAQAPEGELVAELGWPTPCEARAAIDALCTSIWAPAA